MRSSWGTLKQIIGGNLVAKMVRVSASSLMKILIRYYQSLTYSSFILLIADRRPRLILFIYSFILINFCF